MSKVLGIIAEYNPFHNGHLYHLQQSIEKTSADFVVCAMSGNFVQRGNTSIIDKWTKTKMAIACGVDVVLELPTIYATSSAENFARGAIQLFNSLGVVNFLSFGIETDDFEALQTIANVLYEEPREYVTMLEHELQKGVSFPKARESAVMLYLNDIKRYMNMMANSNNILAIEYLKALRQLKSQMVPIGIHRKNVQYNDETIVNHFASATAIRKMIFHRQFYEVMRVIPKSSYRLLAEELQQGRYVIDLSKFQKEILYRLRTMTVEEIANLPDVSEGLENAIKNAANSCNHFVDFMSLVKSKRYTQTRLQRILIYALLGIDKKMMEASKKTVPYARVLGVSEKGKEVLSAITKDNLKINLITSPKKFLKESRHKILKEMLETDIYATNVYTLGYEKNSLANLDYTNKLVTQEDIKGEKLT